MYIRIVYFELLLWRISGVKNESQTVYIRVRMFVSFHLILRMLEERGGVLICYYSFNMIFPKNVELSHLKSDNEVSHVYTDILIEPMYILAGILQIRWLS